MININTLGDRLIAARKEKGLSQKELAKELGMSPTGLYNWEKNKREPNILQIMNICNILNISADWLVGLSEQKEKPTMTDGEFKEILCNPIKRNFIERVAALSDEDFGRLKEVFDVLLRQSFE